MVSSYTIWYFYFDTLVLELADEVSIVTKSAVVPFFRPFLFPLIQLYPRQKVTHRTRLKVPNYYIYPLSGVIEIVLVLIVLYIEYYRNKQMRLAAAYGVNKKIESRCVLRMKGTLCCPRGDSSSLHRISSE